MRKFYSFEDIEKEKYRRKLEKEVATIQLKLYWKEKSASMKAVRLIQKNSSFFLKFFLMRIFLRLVKK